MAYDFPNSPAIGDSYAQYIWDGEKWNISGSGGGPGPGTDDTTPNAFVFADITNATISTDYTSNTITVAGISAAATVTVTGGTYSKNGGAFTSTAGSAVLGDTFAVRVTTASGAGVTVNVVLTIGGVSSTYSVTTTGVAADTTPNPFTFTNIPNADISTLYTSNAITVQGIDAPTPVTITGGMYSKNGGAYTAAAGTASVGDQFIVQVTSLGGYALAATAVLTIGGVDGSFVVTTADADLEPDAFTFTPVTNANGDTLYTSNSVTIQGINSPAYASVNAPWEYSKDGGAFTGVTGFAVAGSQFRVRLTSDILASTTTIATLTVGSGSAPFSVTTAAFATLVLAWTSAATVFNPVFTLTGYVAAVGDILTVEVDDDNTFISLFDSEANTMDGAEAALGVLSYTGIDTLLSGVTYYARVKLNRGGIFTTSNVVTKTMSSGVDATPDAFTFTDVTGAPGSRGYTSNTITVAGIDTSVAVTITGTDFYTYSKNGGPASQDPTTAVAGDTFKINVTSSSAASTPVSATLTIGGVSDTYTVTTGTDVTAPAPVSYSPADNATNVSTFINIILTLNEPVVLSSVLTYARLYKISDSSLVYTWTLPADIGSTPGKIELVGGTNVVMHLAAPLATGTEYGVVWSYGLVYDIAGNGLPTRFDPTLWSFTTSAPDTTAPTITTFLPAYGATGVSLTPTLSMTFNEAVVFNTTGTIQLLRASDLAVIEAWDVSTEVGSTAGKIEIVGGTVVTMHLTSSLTAGIQYVFLVPNNTIKDLAGNVFPGISGGSPWLFTTTGAAWTPAGASTPAFWWVDASVGSSITATGGLVNGNPITQLNDLGTGAHNMTPDTVTAPGVAPTYVTSAINGLPGISFMSNGNLTTVSTGFFLNQPFLICVVWKQGATAPDPYGMLIQGSVSSVGDRALLFNRYNDSTPTGSAYTAYAGGLLDHQIVINANAGPFHSCVLFDGATSWSKLNSSTMTGNAGTMSTNVTGGMRFSGHTGGATRSNAIVCEAFMITYADHTAAQANYATDAANAAAYTLAKWGI